MPRHCSAAGCKSRDTRETRKAGITFHRLPKRGKPRRTLWILNSRRTDPQGKGQWDPQSQFIYFCSKHFTPENFELSGVSGYRRLKEDALPTVFETLPRQRRTAAERAWRGASKQATAKRRTRRQINLLKQEKEPGPQTGAGPNAGGGAVFQDTEKTEEAGWVEDDLKSEGAAKTLERTLPPAASPPPSSLPHPSPGLSHIPPLSPRPPLGPPPPLSETAPSLPVSTVAVPSPSSPPPSSPPPPETPSTLHARPASPSRYMRRLPPPPGFYLPKEHSYAQLCPLVWKKRYEKAIDGLEKSVRLLNAARRREARLRQTLLWLRETGVRHGVREGGSDGGRGRQAPAQGPGAREVGPAERGVRQGAELRESKAERLKADLDLVEAGLAETGEWGDWAPPPPTKGFCFYCGRGRGDGEGWDIPGKERPRGRPRKPWEGERDEEEEEEVDEEKEKEEDETGGETGAEECCYYYYCEDEEGGTSGREAGLHLVTLEQAVAKPQGALHPLDLAPVAPDAPPQPVEPAVHAANEAGDEGEQRLFWVQEGVEGRLILLPVAPTQPTQGPLLAAAEVGDGEEQRLFWVQEGMEGRLVLLPAAAVEDDGGGANRTGTEAMAAEATVAAVAGGQAFQRLAVSAGFQNAVADRGERQGLAGGGRVPRTKGRGEIQEDARPVAGSGDVRERLKEHLEGFQLQLSNEFIH